MKEPRALYAAPGVLTNWENNRLSALGFAVQLGHDQMAMEMTDCCSSIGSFAESHRECATLDIEFLRCPFDQPEDCRKISGCEFFNPFFVAGADDYEMEPTIPVRPAVLGDEPVAGSSKDYTFVVFEILWAEWALALIGNFLEDLSVLGGFCVSGVNHFLVHILLSNWIKE